MVSKLQFSKAKYRPPAVHTPYLLAYGLIRLKAAKRVLDIVTPFLFFRQTTMLKEIYPFLTIQE